MQTSVADGSFRAVSVERLRDTVNLLPRIAALEPDAVLIDLEWPSRASLEQAFRIPQLARLPVAIFVDASDRATVDAAIAAGVAAYVVDGLRKERVRAVLDVAISRFRAIARLEAELEQAKTALDERKTIERAKAILMKQRNLPEDAAYALLRRTAMSQNRKIADLSRALLAAEALLGSGSDTGSDPGSDPKRG